MAVKPEGVVWIISLFLRFLWVFSPQTGYIHPDEFFQSPEIVAGDIFGFQTLRTWEFNETFPIRSILLPHMFTGLPFKAILNLQSLMTPPWTFYTRVLVVAPRLVFCFLSTVIDFCAFKIGSLLGEDPAPILAVIGTSYVTLVFNTRPFSNTLESVLFALVLWFLAEHVFPKEKLKARIVNIGIGIIMVAGIWNRPTFLAYALVPTLAWCYSFFKDIRISLESIEKFFREAFFVGIGAISTAILFIIADSIYFGRFTVTPINFIKYNLDSSHLKEHGLHPRFTHFLVNVPLLFGVLAVLFYFHIAIAACTRNLHGSRTLSQNNKGLAASAENNTLSTLKQLFCKVLTLSAFVPIGLLSIIPHQEPRFLTPILMPLAILFAYVIIGPKQSSFVTISWIIWNAIGCLLFGVLHQGGMYSCLQHLQTNLSQRTSGERIITHHVVFSNTYMPPRHLLAWPGCSDNNNCQMVNRLLVHDLGGQTREKLSSWLNELVLQNKMDKDRVHQVFLVCPSTLYFHHPDFYKVKEFFPHLTLEDPPNIASLLEYGFGNNCKEKGKTSTECLSNEERQSYWQFFTSWLNSNLSLYLYEYKIQEENMKNFNIVK